MKKPKEILEEQSKFNKWIKELTENEKDHICEIMEEYSEVRVIIAQKYWAERIEELIQHHEEMITTNDFYNLVEEIKTAKYFP